MKDRHNGKWNWTEEVRKARLTLGKGDREVLEHYPEDVIYYEYAKHIAVKFLKPYTGLDMWILYGLAEDLNAGHEGWDGEPINPKYLAEDIVKEHRRNKVS